MRLNALEAAPREYTEPMNVTQAKLVIGWRLGEAMEEPNPAALRVFASLFGGSTASKLFVNVREKLSLCYFASAIADVHKGVLLAYAGTEFDNVGRAKEEIFAQLAAIADGEITDEEMNAARADVKSALKSALDIQGALEGFYLSAALDGADYSPEELGALVDDVTKEDMITIARGCECDMIYTLTGDGSEEDEDDEEIAERGDLKTSAKHCRRRCWTTACTSASCRKRAFRPSLPASGPITGRSCAALILPACGTTPPRASRTISSTRCSTCPTATTPCRA